MPRSTFQLPSSARTRLRWREEDARAVLEQLRASGVSVREFAAGIGVDAQRLYRWRTELGRSRVKASPAFVEIKPAVPVAVEVVLRGGQILRVHNGFDDDTVRRLVTLLDGHGSRC